MKAVRYEDENQDIESAAINFFSLKHAAYVMGWDIGCLERMSIKLDSL